MNFDFIAALQRHRSLVLLITLGATVYGALAFFELPSGIYPEVDFPRVVVVARVGNLPPSVVVVAATRPIEEALATVPGLERLRSRTIRGATEINVQFAPGTDMWRGLQLVEAQVAAVRGDLPDGAEITVERVTATALPILTFNVDGTADPRVLRDVAERTIRPALTRVEGIGLVEVQGGDAREIEVVLRPAALAAVHLTPSDITDRLAETDVMQVVGRAVDAHQALTVTATSEATTAAEIAALPIATGAHGPVPLSTVADVFEGAEDRTVTTSGPNGDCVVVSVSRAPGASAPDVVVAARAVVDRLRASKAFPAGVHVAPVYDQSELITDSMHGVRDAIVLGILLSFIVLAVFLRDLRAGAAAAIVVPITLVCTFGAMRLAGQTLNLMSLGGLAVAIGLVVDNGIVVVEAIVRRREEGLSVDEAAIEGTRDLFAAVVGTTLTTVVVFAPLGLLEGIIGHFFGALAITLCAAVLLSLVSVAIVPIAARALFRPTDRPPATGGLATGYGRMVRRAVRHPVLGVSAIVGLAIAGILAARTVGTGFLPQMDEGAFVIDFSLPPGTSLEETDAVTRGIDRVLATTAGVRSFTRRTGTEMGPATATQQNRGDILVGLKPRGERGSIESVIDDVREHVALRAPEATIEFVQVLQDVLDDLAGTARPIEVRIFGEDPSTLDRLAGEVHERLSKMTELEDVSPGVEGSVPILQAALRPDTLARLGETPGGVARDLEVALSGRVAAHARIGDRLVAVRVRAPDDVRFSPSAIADFPLAYGGGTVPLSAVAEVSKPRGQAVLRRENLRSMALITAGVRGSDLGGATASVSRELAKWRPPAGYTFEVGGQAETAGRARADLARVFGLGIVLVLGILLVQLGSERLAFVVILGAPLSLVGAFLTLAATGIALNASSLMGCVLLAGLVVKNGILLLDRANIEHATCPDFGEALARAGERRLRPILMTTAATIAGLIPLALGIGAGSELQRPLAVATIGGLVLSTLVTLFAVPALAKALVRT